jgi:ankyrin repeat protein
MRPTSPRCIVPLLAAGAKVDQLSDWQQTPLHHAASYQDDIRFLEPLIDSGAEVNARDRDGNTPLGCAALQDHPRSAAFLLDCGADIDSQTPSGWNALLMSVDCNSHAVLRLLLQRGADPTLKLSTGCTILHRVAERGDIKTIEILTAARLKEVDINAVNSENCTARDLIRGRDQISAEFVASFETLLKSMQPRVFERGEAHESDEDDAAQFADAEEYLI